MPEGRFQIGEYWLDKRAGSDNWCRCWFDRDTRQTCRASLGTRDLEAAKVKLAQWVTLNARVKKADPADRLLAEVCARYFAKHGPDIIGQKSQRRSLEMMLERLDPISVDEFTMEVQNDLVRRMKAEGYSIGTIKRGLLAVKAATNWAWKNRELSAQIPYLSLPDAEPRERVLTIAEMAALWDAIEPHHLRVFFLLLLGTAARPAALLELTREQCDVVGRLITLNPAGRDQTKKRRPTIAIPDFLVPVIESVPAGPLVTYKGSAIQKINLSWRDARNLAGLDAEVVPTTIRHTIATELRRRGVPEWEVEGQLGHAAQGKKTTARYAKYAPDYLSKAREAIDQIASEIDRVAARSFSEFTNVRASSVLVPFRGLFETPRNTGAGEGIRTLDPNLGKVAYTLPSHTLPFASIR